MIKDGYTHFKVQLQNILYIKTIDKYIYLHTKERRYVLRASLTQFLEEYEMNTFVRVHKSFAVNRNHVKSFTTDTVRIEQEEIPLSRAYKKEFLASFHHVK